VAGIIRGVQSQGVPALVGYSWGGWLAFEVARQLEQREGIRCFTALIGTDAPLRRTSFIRRLAHFLWNFFHCFWRWLREAKRWQRILRWREMARWARQSLFADRLQVPKNLVSWPIARHMIALIETYGPPPKSDVAVDLFRERDVYPSQPDPIYFWQPGHLPDGGWNHWLRKPARVHWQRGDHATILKPPNVSELAQAIRQAMDEQNGQVPD